MTIRRQEIVKLEDVLHLYQAVGWTNYTHQPQMLKKALSHSLAIYLALDGDAVVGGPFGRRWFFIDFCPGFDRFA